MKSAISYAPATVLPNQLRLGDNLSLNANKRHRFPPDIISYAVWLYYRFNLSHRRCAGPFIEDLLAVRGITVSRKPIFSPLKKPVGSNKACRL
jgi:hypothetical protein